MRCREGVIRENLADSKNNDQALRIALADLGLPEAS